MTQTAVLVAVAAVMFTGGALSQFMKSQRKAAAQRAQVVAADALLAHGVPRSTVVLHVLGRADWSEQNTLSVVRETGGDAAVASSVLTGVTHALSLDHIDPFGPQRIEIDGVTAWTRLAMHLLDSGVSRQGLARTVEDAINTYPASLPLRYTAWAYAAGMGREEAIARWRTARINMDETRRIARERGTDLSGPHAISAAAA